MADATIKAVEFPGRVFKSQEELFKVLKDNAKRIIGLKMAADYRGSAKKQFSFVNAAKAFSESAVKAAGFEAKEGCIYPIISTTKYLDSHGDVHFNGCFTKTVKEQQGSVMYVLDHELKYDQILAWPEHVKMFRAEIPWSIVGKDYKGETEALIFEIKKEDLRRPEVLKDIESGVVKFENSIRMRYWGIKLALNSTSKEFVQEKAYWDKRIEEIANKDVAEERGYFWGVEELSIYKEGSLVVAGGSNDATSIYTKGPEEESTHKDEPVEEATQQKKGLLL